MNFCSYNKNRRGNKHAGEFIEDKAVSNKYAENK